MNAAIEIEPSTYLEYYIFTSTELEEEGSPSQREPLDLLDDGPIVIPPSAVEFTWDHGVYGYVHIRHLTLTTDSQQNVRPKEYCEMHSPEAPFVRARLPGGSQSYAIIVVSLLCKKRVTECSKACC